MTLSIWLTFFSYAVITAITPGPNNILALNATSKYGVKNSMGLLVGIYFGFFCVMVLCGISGAAISLYFPNIIFYMKYIGAAYILWLAWKIFISKPAEATEDDNSNSFLRGFLLQFINVKIIIYGITIFTSIILPNTQAMSAVVLAILLSTLIGNLSTHLWAVTGAVFTKIFQRYWQASNAVMSLILVYSAFGIVTA